MVRLHLVQAPDNSLMYRVSVRRKPIGYVQLVHGTELVPVQPGQGHHRTNTYRWSQAMATTMPTTGWQAYDLDGNLIAGWHYWPQPHRFQTRDEALKELLDYWSAKCMAFHPWMAFYDVYRFVKMVQDTMDPADLPGYGYLSEPGSPQAEAARQAYNATPEELGAAAVKAAKKL